MEDLESEYEDDLSSLSSYDGEYPTNGSRSPKSVRKAKVYEKSYRDRLMVEMRLVSH